MGSDDQFLMTHAGQSLAIGHPGGDAATLLEFLFRDTANSKDDSAAASGHLRIAQTAIGWTLESVEAGFRSRTGALWDLALPLMNAALLHLVMGDPKRIHFHGALVSDEHGSILLPGMPGCGKTTASLVLCHHGFRYHSDELVSIDRRTGEITPFPRPFVLRKPVYEMLNANLEWAGALSESGVRFSQHNAWISHREINPDYRDESPPLRAMVFPRFDPEGIVDLVPNSSARSGLVLMQSQFKSAAHDDHGFECITAMVRSIPTYNMHFQRPEQVAALIREV